MQTEENFYLFLDDCRSPEDTALYLPNNCYLYADWVVVRSYTEFVEFVAKYFDSYSKIPLLISFDHDIASFTIKEDGTKYEMTGLTCAKWLCDFCMDHGIKYIHYLCHSANHEGKKNIESYINQFNNLNKNGSY